MFDKVMGCAGLSLLGLALLASIVAAVIRWRREAQEREQAKLEQAFQKARLKVWNE